MGVNAKAVLLGAMALAAVLSARAALGSVLKNAPAAAAESEYEYQWSVEPEDAQFVLREYGGCVGVFEPGGRLKPTAVTDIEVSSLRGADRAMLQSGIAVRDRAELVALLEDLGS